MCVRGYVLHPWEYMLDSGRKDNIMIAQSEEKCTECAKSDCIICINDYNTNIETRLGRIQEDEYDTQD